MLLNAYDRHKPVTRVNPENNNEVEEFDIWSGKALAYLGILDPQLRDRVIEIRLERKPSTVKKPNCERPPVNIRTNCNANASVGLATTQRPLARSGRLISISQNDRAGNNWEFFLAIAGVIDPDNVDRVVDIALKIEGETSCADRESDEDAVLKGIKEVYQDVCDDINLSFDDPKTDIFLSITTIRTVLNISYGSHFSFLGIVGAANRIMERLDPPVFRSTW